MSDINDASEYRDGIPIKDSWKSLDPYEYFMGRWSRVVARAFVQWLSPPSGLTWLDVGCGSGALTEAVVDGCAPSQITAIDQSEDFVREARQRWGDIVRCQVGDALSLPLPDAAVDIVVSGLVLNFISDPNRALIEMGRVTVPGGTVAVYVWDYAGSMDFLNSFWDAAVSLDPKASDRHEGFRFRNSNAESMCSLFAEAGYTDIDTAPIEIETNFSSFDDYWRPFLGGQGPAPSYLASLDESHRWRLKESLLKTLPIQPDGSIRLRARAWAVRGTTPFLP